MRGRVNRINVRQYLELLFKGSELWIPFHRQYLKKMCAISSPVNYLIKHSTRSLNP